MELESTLRTKSPEAWNPIGITENADITVKKAADIKLQNLMQTWPNTFVPQAFKENGI